MGRLSGRRWVILVATLVAVGTVASVVAWNRWPPTARRPSCADIGATRSAPPPALPAQWNLLPVGAPADVDVVTSDNVIHGSDGRSVAASLPGGRAVEVRRIGTGWLLGTEASVGRDWWFVAPHGEVRRVLDGVAQQSIAISADDRRLAAWNRQDRRVTVYRLPEFTVEAVLTPGRSQVGDDVGGTWFAGDWLMVKSGYVGDREHTFSGTTAWNWRTGQVRAHRDVSVAAATADGRSVLLLRSAGSAAAEATVAVVDGDGTLRPGSTGCVPAGVEWRLSPDGTRLIGLRWTAARSDPTGNVDLVQLPVAELGKGAPELVASMPFLRSGRLGWTDGTEVHVGVAFVADRSSRRGWGLLRCGIPTRACDRVALRHDGRAVGLDVGLSHGSVRTQP